ncbi:class I SAM-dependent methyltransferase [Sporosarcina sp. D27]|uniref:class I SAM-dependent methyltransferase n=1 Tax=Sporosarcina sp. D27 TaxID=1382305 RepID=UPI00047192C3|nr:class I SAM-dependent methyltransferase [Sporosarcina sp. D27]
MAGITETPIGNLKRVPQILNLNGTLEQYGKYRHGYPPELLKKLKEFGIGIKNQNVLDIGTSNGLFARDLANQGCMVTGIDLSTELIEQAQQINERDQMPIKYLVGNAESLPFEDSSFEIVTAVYCWHWFNKLKVAKEVKRVLQENGKLAIINYEWVPSLSDIALHTQNLIEEFNESSKKNNDTMIYPEWVDDIYKAGFSEVETFSFDVNVNYTIESWIGRIQASPEVGGALEEKDIELFSDRLESYLRKRAVTYFKIPYKVFAIIGKA